MKIWLLEDNQRTGPFELFQVRKKITNGDINRNTPAWFKGMNDWGSLSDIKALEEYLVEAETSLPKTITPKKESLEQATSSINETPEAAVITHPNKLFAVRRFFARFLDASIFIAFFQIIQASNGINPFLPTEHPFLEILLLSIYVIFDAVMLHLCHTTPGKFLLNIELKFGDASRPPILSALGRSYRVWFWGLGMLKIAILTLPLSAWFARRMGNFAWDLTKPHFISCHKLSTPKIFLYFACLFGISFVSMEFIPEHYYMDSPLMKSIIEMTEIQTLNTPSPETIH